jgi:hypothetical protein
LIDFGEDGNGHLVVEPLDLKFGWVPFSIKKKESWPGEQCNAKEDNNNKKRQQKKVRFITPKKKHTWMGVQNGRQRKEKVQIVE